MMKWGRKKPSSSSSASNSSLSSSSSQPHLISHVFPLSWLSKFKHSTPDKPESGLSRGSHKREQNLQKVNPKSPPNNYKYSTISASGYRDGSRFYTQDDDGFWRLSFGDQDDDNNGCTKLVVPPRYCGGCKSNVKEATATKKKSNYKKQQLGVQETGEVEVERSESLRKTYRRIIEATSELQRELDEVKDGYRKSVEKEMPELELFQVMQMMGRSNLGEQQNHKKHEFEEEKREWEKMKEDKIKEVLSKNEKQRKSVHIGGKVRSVRSPRTPSNKAETCKIRAIENLRKARMKKKMNEMVLDEKAAALESFAVVKCSREPHEDFRESMIEMIVEKRIRKPEQLEELLACYLTLNADEYHDLIIKVFRQVWCELEEQGYYNEKSLLEEHCRCN